MQEEPIVMLDIEATLKEDSDGEAAKKIAESFQGEAREIKAQMDAGMAPDEFAVAEKMKSSLETAAAVVKVYQGRENS